MRIEPESAPPPRPAPTPTPTPPTTAPATPRGTPVCDTFERAPAATGPFSAPTRPSIPPPRPGELVNPAIASQPLSVIREEIRRAALRGALPEDMYHVPLEDRAAMYSEAVKAGDEAVAAFDRIHREELSRLEDENGKHLPAPERAALASEAVSTAIARVNLGHAGGVGDVDLNSMTELEKFNYLRAEIEARGGEFRTEDMAMNVVGVRGLDHGVTGDNAPNEYNDTIYVLRMENGTPHVYEFNATTDYGDWDKVKDAGYGVTVLTEGTYQWAPLLMAEGSYMMNVGTHAWGTSWSHEALVETGGSGVTSIADVNGNHRVDPEEMSFSFTDQGTNVHKGGLPDRPVNAYSAGCQVIPKRPSGDESSTLYWEDFHQMITEDPVYGTKEDRIPYTLADVLHMPSTR
jgi:hypothetical protein